MSGVASEQCLRSLCAFHGVALPFRVLQSYKTAADVAASTVRLLSKQALPCEVPCSPI